MKKLSALFLALCLLMSACGSDAGSAAQEPQLPPPPAVESPENTVDDNSGEQPPQQEQESPSQQQPPPEQSGTLLERAELCQGQQQLKYLPNSCLEGMSSPQIHILGEGDMLLLSQPVFAEDRSDTLLRVVSLHDGSVLAECSVFTSGLAAVQAGGEYISVSDSANGSISIFDNGLNLLHSYKPEQDFENWFMSMDCSTLYVLAFQEGVFAMDPESGERTQLLGNADVLTVMGHNAEFVVFSYVDTANGRKCCASLNLIDGSIQSAPMGGNYGTGSRVESTWLLSHPDGCAYSLFRNGVRHEIAAEPGRLRLLYPLSCVLTVSEDGRSLALFSGDGEYISSCTLQDGNCSLIQNFVWSDLLGGWLFLDKTEQGCSFMLWDPTVATEGENLVFVQQPTQPEPMVSSHLYERAREIYEEYGVEIAFAEQCRLEYSHFSSYMLTDENFIASCLDILESVFASYPPGFLEQLKCGYVNRIRVELVGGLTCSDLSMFKDSSAAFAQQMDDYYLIVADGFLLTDRVMYHELAHVIDFRLEWYAAQHPDALFSEEAWLAVQPEGFDFAYSYMDIPDSVLQYVNSGYFVTDYACTWPTEDRATLMAAAMQDMYNFQGNPGMVLKLEFLSRCIRESFDTTGWPEMTRWERYIQN